MAARIPVMIAFEGWDAAGKGTLITQVLIALDPGDSASGRPIPRMKKSDSAHFLWRFWTKASTGERLPFLTELVRQSPGERVDKIVPKSDWSRAYDEIQSFERQLVDGGAVIVKFFLHISKKEQKKRLRNCRIIRIPRGKSNRSTGSTTGNTGSILRR